MPDFAREAVYARIAEILGASPDDDGFTSLTLPDRAAIAEILAATLPEFPEI